MPASAAPPSRNTTAGGRAAAEWRVLDLFCGAGGLSQGLHEAGGYRTVRAVEQDPVAAASYAANFGDDVVYVGAIGDWLAEGYVPEVDVVIGGPPCQGFSTLGRQDAEDLRNELWREYAETIVRAHPRYFVLENVAAFLHSPQFDHLRAATEAGGTLADYDFTAAVLNAADYGAAQARRRAILIGHLRDLPAPGMPPATHVDRHIPLSVALRYVRRRVERTELPDRQVEVNGRAQPGRFTSRELHVGRRYSSVSLARIRSIPTGGNRMDIPVSLRPACWRTYATGSMDVMGRLCQGTVGTARWRT